MAGGTVGHLLEWRLHERDGTWQGWVSWVQTTGVPRRVLCNDGRIRPWTRPGALRDSTVGRSRRVMMVRLDWPALWQVSSYSKISDSQCTGMPLTAASARVLTLPADLAGLADVALVRASLVVNG